MILQLPWGPLADQSRMMWMGERFRGGADGIDSGQLATFALIFAVLALVLWIGITAVNLLAKLRGSHPTMLFLELCQAHHVDWKLRIQLWIFAFSSRLEHPAQLFVDPQLLSDEALATWPESQRNHLLKLRESLFS